MPIDCGAEPCTSRTNPLELQKAARAAGVKLVLLGGVQKMSTLVQWAKIQIADEDGGQVVFDRFLTFRGDNDEAWRRAESSSRATFSRSLPGIDKPLAARRSSSPSSTSSLRISAAALDHPGKRCGREQLKLATETARKLIEDSGRYSLVDVSNADAAEAKGHTLHDCDGCDAKIALKLGADQSMVGIVSRITRTDYAVTFKLRDARTGAPIAVEQTDLRIGANYSWNRGAAWLIRNWLLDKQQAQQ